MVAGHYGRFLPQDKAALADKILTQVWEAGMGSRYGKQRSLRDLPENLIGIAPSAMQRHVRTDFQNGVVFQAAKKARISDRALCKAIEQVARGQADDLGGGVFKKRLNDNMHRSIVLAKAGEYWVFAYLFAKKDRANIDDDELMAFRKLAELYRRKTQAELDAEIGTGALLEICNDD